MYLSAIWLLPLHHVDSASSTNAIVFARIQSVVAMKQIVDGTVE